MDRTENSVTQMPWSSHRAWSAALVLAIANAISFVDRTTFALLVDAIKLDLRISELQAGFLSGLGVVLLNGLIALPVARLADRMSRRKIVATALLVSGLASAACGLARNFASLVVARITIGAADAAVNPVSQSILADHFPKQRLPLAMGLFSMGIYLGNGLALIVGGAVVGALSALGAVEFLGLGPFRPWQLAFIVAGVPSLVVAVAVLLLREPSRSIGTAAATSLETPRDLLWRNLMGRPSIYLGLFGAFCLLVMQGQGSAAWIPAFFARKFGWEAREIGASYGVVVLVCGTSGALLGGIWGTRARLRGAAHVNLRTCLIGLVGILPFALTFPLVPSAHLALVLIGGMNFFAGFPFAAGYAALQELTPNQLRAQTTALFQLLLTVVGGGIGPILVALFTELLFANDARLHHSLFLAALVTLPLAVLLAWVSMRSASRLKHGPAGTASLS